MAAAEAASGQPLSEGLIYTALQPCRLIDTRLAGGPLPPGSSGARTFNVVGVAAPGSLAAYQRGLAVLAESHMITPRVVTRLAAG